MEGPILDLEEIAEDKCKHLELNCLWTITSKDTSLTVIITCVKWTFNFEFCVRVTAHPMGAPNFLKQKDLDDHHPLLRPLTDALNIYEVFSERCLKTYELDILEELFKCLDVNFY